MLILKQGVRLFGLCEQMVWAAMVVDAAYAQESLARTVVTAGSDSKHKVGSLHYAGRALDFRMNDIQDSAKKARLIVSVTQALGADFDVLRENEGTPAEHLHVEYDPKEPYGLA